MKKVATACRLAKKALKMREESMKLWEAAVKLDTDAAQAAKDAAHRKAEKAKQGKGPCNVSCLVHPSPHSSLLPAPLASRSSAVLYRS